MSTKINVAGVWKEPTPKINVAGVWKTPDKVSINVAGVWKEVGGGPSGPDAVFNTNGDTNYRLGGTCYAGLYISNTGSEYEFTNTGGTTLIGTWLNSGSTSDVWVECVLISGTWNNLNAGTGVRLATTSNRFWRCLRSTPGTHTVACNFKFWDAASGGNLLDETGTIFFTAEMDY